MLKGERLTKSFGGLRAVSSLDFEIQKGEIVGLIGPNGSGKTTLFNLISGFYRPDEGCLFFKGKEITGKPPYAIAQMGIGRTFQIVRPLPDFTLLENVRVTVFTEFRDSGNGRGRESIRQRSINIDFSF